MPVYQFIILLVILLFFGALTTFFLIRLVLLRKQDSDALSSRVSGALSELETRLRIRSDAMADEQARDIEQLRSSLNDSLSMRLDSLGSRLAGSTNALSENISARQLSLEQHITEKQEHLEKQITTRQEGFEKQVGEQLRFVQSTLSETRESVDKQLDSIRGVVNEKLQQTLNERLSESFRRVDERLAEVHKGLGEMQALASGVGDLKKVLSNVKTRGTLGEIQLRAILDEVLAPEQFETNFDAGKGGSERVEFAIKLPNDGSSAVYLPIDSKFPADMYVKLTEAYESADPAQVETAQRGLKEALMRFAKDIFDKYINPPRTTNFAIMFLPTEGLYAEAVRLGLVETLQAKYRINIAGPSTMAALLNSLQMGFRTLAIQKRSSEVWDLLSKIKREFNSFDDVLTSTRKSLQKANDDLDKLIGTRTRQIKKALNKVEELPQCGGAPAALIEMPAEDTDDVD